MSAIFLNIAGTVLVLNILFLLIPDGKFEKYVRFVAGLIVILTVAGNLFHIRINHDVLRFDENAFQQNGGELELTVKENLAADTLEEKIMEQLALEVDITVELEGEKIQKLTVQGAKGKEAAVTEILLQYCDINRSQIVLK